MKKEKSLFRKIIEIQWEQAKRRKALRILSKQEWSVDFLTLLLCKVAKLQNQAVELVVHNPSGTYFTLKASPVTESVLDDDDDIFNKLDDNAAIESFIRDHSVR